MKAVVCDRYGPPDVLRIMDVERPVPKENEVLVKVRATTVTRSDCAIRQPYPRFSRLLTGWRRPRWRILGYELAGEVAAIGSAVTGLAVGDEVFGANGGLRKENFGAHAEFICLPESGALARKPPGLSFEEAAAVCDGAILALMCLRAAKLARGQRVMIYGASGSIGTAAVQLAKYFGTEVTAVCDTKNVETVTSLGADQVIDYTREDFIPKSPAYDVIFDAVGRLPFRRCAGALKRGGTYLATDRLWNFALVAWTALVGARKVKFPVPPRYTRENVEFVKQVIEAGKYRPVIDRIYPLADVVEATRYVETRQKTGNVVLTVGMM